MNKGLHCSKATVRGTVTVLFAQNALHATAIALSAKLYCICKTQRHAPRLLTASHAFADECVMKVAQTLKGARQWAGLISQQLENNPSTMPTNVLTRICFKQQCHTMQLQMMRTYALYLFKAQENQRNIRVLSTTLTLLQWKCLHMALPASGQHTVLSSVPTSQKTIVTHPCVLCPPQVHSY